MRMRKLKQKTIPKGKCSWVIGIDEAGRGPLAGPVYVAAVAVRGGFKHVRHRMSNMFGEKGIRDSKKMTPRERGLIYRELKKLVAQGNLRMAVASRGARLIDRRGITAAVAQALSASIYKLRCAPRETQVFLDGLLKAPPVFIHQKTIIRGDETVAVIALASVVAKVTRDRKMVRLAKQYPDYGFEVHKGYGVLKHRQTIERQGPCPIHRRTFLKTL